MARAKRIVSKLAGSAESALIQINLLRNHQRFPRLIQIDLDQNAVSPL
jgi:hypothetical protein